MNKNKYKTASFAALTFAVFFLLGFGTTKYLKENPIDFNSSSEEPEFQLKENNVLSLNTNVEQLANPKTFILENITTGFSNSSENTYVTLRKGSQDYLAKITSDEQITIIHEIEQNENIEDLKIYSEKIISYLYTEPDFLDQFLVIQTDTEVSKIALGSLAEKAYTSYFYDAHSKQVYLTSKDRDDVLFIDILLPNSKIQNYFKTTTLSKDAKIINVENDYIYLNDNNKCFGLNSINLKLEEEKCEFIRNNRYGFNTVIIDHILYLINTSNGETHELYTIPENASLDLINTTATQISFLQKEGLLEYKEINCMLETRVCVENEENNFPNIKILKQMNIDRKYILYENNGNKILLAEGNYEESTYSRSIYRGWLRVGFAEYTLLDLITE